MANTIFTRLFDKSGTDMNLGLTSSQVVAIYSQTDQDVLSLSGNVYFPKVSTKLIESQQLYLLQEVTGPTSSSQLRKIPGSVTTTSGNSTVVGTYTDFTSLTSGVDIRIENTDYTILSVIGATSMILTTTPSVTLTTENIYKYDYLSYSELRSTPGTFKEFLNVYFEDETQTSFFLYSIDYSEDVPFIQKSSFIEYELVDGSADSIDPLTGRIQLTDPNVNPTQINVGFSSDLEGVYDEVLNIDIERQYIASLTAVPVVSGDTLTITIGGTSQIPYILSNSFFYLQGVTGSSVTTPYYEVELEPLSIGITGSDTYVVFNNTSITNITVGTLSSYRLLWKNTDSFVTLLTYGETEAEDERFKLVLENFGRKMDFDKEYIFRDSDINEALPDNTLLNNKRKELLLEGDSIFPTMGSYKSLINVINYFGYYDLRLKEYFLNVNANYSNFGKYTQLLVPRDDTQRKEVKASWELVPSSIYSKTSLFGLFYDLNRPSGEVDDYGIPVVEDAFMFSPEEVLIKLFGLKELLKNEFLPLNARILDITGEGIYFERIRLDSWSDNLNNITINLGAHIDFSILPKTSYISDLRRIDQFYINKLTQQGITGFLGATPADPLITGASGGSTILSLLYDTNIVNYESFLQSAYDANGNYTTPIDPTWEFMPPGISNVNFNEIARRLDPLPDSASAIVGAPLLLEPVLDVTWEEGDFNWSHLSILGPTGVAANINIWTWESIGRGQFIDIRWTAEKGGLMPFSYDSGRLSIDDYLVNTIGATLFTIQATMEVTSLSGSSVSTIQITNPGYGYTSVPSIQVLGTTGATAVIDVTLSEDGYIIGGTVSYGGTGYSDSVDIFGATVHPTIIVEAPAVSYENTTRVLHSISLPYEGEYQIGMYLYDITNSFTVQFKSHYAHTRNTEFVSVHRMETPERTWKDFEALVDAPDRMSFGEVPSSGARLIEWDEVTGPWFYPIHVDSSWQDANISWESLNYSQFMDQTLYEDSLDTSYIEINRDTDKVTLAGNLLSLVDVGDSLFFVREESAPEQHDILIPINGVQSSIPGVLTGAVGATAILTSVDTTAILSTGDSVWFNAGWYSVVSVDPSKIDISQQLTVSSVGQGLYHKSSLELVVNMAESHAMNPYSRLLLSVINNFELIDPSTVYMYVDGISATGFSYTVKTNEIDIRKLILKNSILGEAKQLYATWGIFAGTYAIEVTGKILTGNNTQFILNDVNKELYYLDGNFAITNADYDVDYAEYRIGSNSLTYEAADEISWEEGHPFSWFGLEYHGGVPCGFVIPYIAPGGSITVDEFDSFQFSGDINLLMGITGAKSALQFGTIELSDSTNEGIRKYDYMMLPEDELYLRTVGGTAIGVLSSTSAFIYLDDVPVNLQIPAYGTCSLAPSIWNSYNVLWPSSVTNTGGLTTFVVAGSVLTGLDGSTVTISSSPDYDGVYNIIGLTGDGVNSIYITVDLPFATGATFYPGDATIDSLTTTVLLPGTGYTTPPSVTFSNGGTGSCTLVNGQVTSINFEPGIGFSTTPILTIDQPEGFRTLDNAVWTGYNWVVISGYDIAGNYLIAESAMSPLADVGTILLLPYEYHKQLINSTLLQQFYFFIHARAINPSSEMLSYVSMMDGVESEWLAHMDRTYSYPLRNSILQGINRGADYLYDKWVYEGSDYPPLDLPPEYTSDVQSIQSRVPYLQTLQSVYSFNDTVISNNQQIVPKFTPVVFNYDTCKIPGKTKPKWTITSENTGMIQVISETPNLMWNFTRDGSYSVKLEIEDGNGNKSVGIKSSFIVIGLPKPYEQPNSNLMLKPVSMPAPVTPSINVLV